MGKGQALTKGLDCVTIADVYDSIPECADGDDTPASPRPEWHNARGSFHFHHVVSLGGGPIISMIWGRVALN